MELHRQEGAPCHEGRFVSDHQNPGHGRFGSRTKCATRVGSIEERVIAPVAMELERTEPACCLGTGHAGTGWACRQREQVNDCCGKGRR